MVNAKRCAICAKAVDPAKENPAFPFCSSRCKLLDLGNWLDGRYAVPGEPVRETEDEPEQ